MCLTYTFDVLLIYVPFLTLWRYTAMRGNLYFIMNERPKYCTI